MLQVIGRAVTLIVIGSASVIGSSELAAQTLRGRVLEDGRGVPVSGATVSLLLPNGEEVIRAETDSAGRFTLLPPSAGDYFLQVVRLGYADTRSPLLALSDQGSAAVDLLVQPLPIGLDGFEVTVQSEIERVVRNFGLRIEDLGRRWIDRQRIEEIPTALRAKDLVRWQGIPGVYVQEWGGPPALTPLCVSFWRAKTLGAANPPCAITFLNGARIDSIEVNQISPEEIESILVLTPVEATGLYGTQGGAGAVLLWTRRGGR